MIQMTIVSSILAILVFSAAALKSMGDADMRLTGTHVAAARMVPEVQKAQALLHYKVTKNALEKNLVGEIH